ncbi:adenosylcobinamide-phosphate synthase CbiB [Pelomonas sp. CA6]|nr:adenosylcobinamide-phosphate synthase CbiB [Pelomonas sp. CA6]MCH7344504.1 adenosylcobinamide-phosphate synthase CbiB [Pelomonas sp. CA6]
MALLLPAAIGVALLVDRLFGEPPARLHPVVAMGRYLGAFSARLTALPARAALVAGGLAWLLGALLCAAIALALETLLWQVLTPWRGAAGWLGTALLLGLLLKPLLAWRMLADEVAEVEAALQRSLDEGRQRLARLVSRDTASLQAHEVREAAIETLAENLNDSVVAPLFWFALAGLPGAAFYRFANTADAMWGYRGRWEWAGKVAARADDALSWLPARLTGLLMIAPWRWRALAREAARTPSPNGGWPMGAMALRLGLSLGKPGVYRLNEPGRPPRPGDAAAARRIAAATLLRAALLLALLAALARGGLA